MIIPERQRDRFRSETTAIAHGLADAFRHLDRLAETRLASAPGRSAYLKAILALPYVEADVDPLFITLLAELRTVRSEPPEMYGWPLLDRTAHLLSAHCYRLAYPEMAFLASGALDVDGWRAFVALHLSPSRKQAASRLNPAFVEEIQPIDPEQAFLRSLTNWAEEPGESGLENRDEAAILIRLCSEEGGRSLDLSYLGLTSLPAALWAVDRAGTACDLAGGLQELRLNANQLTLIPAGIGQLRRLRKLSLNANQLTSLPESIGQLSALTALRVADNELAMLPESIGKLVALESLVADGCLLSRLPSNLDALTCLQELELEDNLLTSVPNAVANLPRNCVVRLFQNPLPLAVRTALMKIEDGPLFMVDGISASLRDARGSAMPHAGRSSTARGKTRPAPAPVPASLEWPAAMAATAAIRASVTTLSSRSLAVTAFDWLTAGVERSAAALSRWQALESDPNAQDFVCFLDMLSQSSELANWNTRALYRERIASLLSALGSQPKLAALCFAAVSERRDTGPADLSISLSRIEALIEDNEAQHHHLGLRETLRLAMQRFRLHLLETILVDHAATLPYSDLTDIRLAFRTGLADRLDLPDDGYGVEDFALSGVEMDDIDRAWVRISEAEGSDLPCRFLIDYAPWRAGLCRHFPDVFEHLLARFDEEDAAVGDQPWDATSSSVMDRRRLLQQQHDARFDAELMAMTAHWLATHETR